MLDIILEEIRVEAIKKIRTRFNHEILDKIVVKAGSTRYNSTLGWYYIVSEEKKYDVYININLIGKIPIEKLISTVIHEIGHMIHRLLFNWEVFRFPTENRTEYSKTNYKENFAEAFEDLFDTSKLRDTSKRDAKMISIIERVNQKEKTKAKSNNRGRAIKITFLDGSIKTYPSSAAAVKELGLKNANCISGYWIKGKSQRAMNAAGIKEIVYI